MLRNKLVALFIISSFLASFIIPKASAETLYQPEKFPLKEMQVQVMPEFDYPQDWTTRDVPSLLIGLYGTITNKSGQDFDGTIEVPVPAKEKGFQVSLAAEFPEANKPEVQRPFKVDNEKGVITWKPQKPIKNNETYQFVIEYYTQSIEVKDKKSFTYEFSNPAAIDQLEVIFYAPMNAKEIVLEPKAQNTQKSDYGEELYYYQYQNVKAGESQKYSFAYKKDGTESTLEAINKQQSSNNSGEMVQQQPTSYLKLEAIAGSSSQPLIGIGGASIIGLALIIAGVFVFLGLKGNFKIGPKKNHSS